MLLVVLVSGFCAAAQGDGQISRTTVKAAQLTLHSMLGRGWIYRLAWFPDGSTLAITASTGMWLHNADDVGAAPRYLAIRADN